ncbi:MAG: hypothetical protein LBM98_02755 [Oscillospiraceae bacterium]|nr:hypothetical protein [Oscillospiraceae bacterium]
MNNANAVCCIVLNSRPGAVRRLCEAPESSRYVECLRREAIQCRSPQIRMLRSRHWIASHL